MVNEPMIEEAAIVPAYTEVCQWFSFLVPASYYAFLRLAFSHGQKVAHLYQPIELHQLTIPATGRFEHDDGSYEQTLPEMVVFAWAGIDGGHYGFFVEEVGEKPREYPIVRMWPGEMYTQLLALNFPDFLSFKIAEANESAQDGLNPAPQSDVADTIQRMRDELGVKVSPRANTIPRRALRKRMASGVIPTVDGIGLTLPPHGVDKEYLASLQWPKQDHRTKPDDRILHEARRRVERQEYGTALILARNFRYLYLFHDWDHGRYYMQATSAIMVEAYRALGRNHAAHKVQHMTEYAMTQDY